MPAESTQWFVKIEGAKLGPYSFVQIKNMLETGQIDETTEVRSEGLGEQWHLIGDLQDFFPRVLKQLQTDFPAAPPEQRNITSDRSPPFHALRISMVVSKVFGAILGVVGIVLALVSLAKFDLINTLFAVQLLLSAFSLYIFADWIELALSIENSTRQSRNYLRINLENSRPNKLPRE